MEFGAQIAPMRGTYGAPMRGRGRKQNWVKEEVELQFRPDKGELIEQRIVYQSCLVLD